MCGVCVHGKTPTREEKKSPSRTWLHRDSYGVRPRGTQDVMLGAAGMVGCGARSIQPKKRKTHVTAQPRPRARGVWLPRDIYGVRPRVTRDITLGVAGLVGCDGAEEGVLVQLSPIRFKPKKEGTSRLNRDPALRACGCLVMSTGFARVCIREIVLGRLGWWVARGGRGLAVHVGGGISLDPVGELAATEGSD